MLFLLVYLTACVSNRLPEVAAIQIPDEELNTRISLTAPDGWDSFKTGDTVTLTIINTSGDKILFDPNYGARIFVFDDDGWIETSNELVSLDIDDVILEPIKDNPASTGTTSIRPKLAIEASNLTVRIYVVGYLYADNVGTDNVTGAFIDVILRK